MSEPGRPVAFAPWLSAALAAVLLADDQPLQRMLEPAAAVGGELLPALAAVERARPRTLPPVLTARAFAAAEGAEEGAAKLLDAVRAVASGIAEQRVDWAAFGGLDLALRVGDAPWRPLSRAEGLAAPFEVGRARLVVAARGLGATGGGGPRLLLRSRLAPPGWRALPLGPFLGDAAPAPGGAVPLMSPGASWVAHLVWAGRGLFAPGTVGPLDLAEAALRGRLVSPAERAEWDARMSRWHAGRLWRRAGEVAAWLGGGERPAWLAEGFGEPGVAAESNRGRAVRLGLRLQDGPVDALRFLAVSLVAGEQEP